MKFLLVDDHALIREAVRGVLRELDPAAAVHEASRWAEATRLLEQHQDFSLVLLDLGLPDSDGFAALADLRTHHPKIPVAILSASCDRGSVVRALDDLGAVGFLPKSGERDVMLNALRLIISGGVYIPPEIFSHAVTPVGAGPGDVPARRPEGPATSPADLGLTARQVDVLALIMRGKSNKAICRTLDLAEPTVKNHVTAILKALKVSNRTEAVIAASSMGWQLKAED
ncbi:MAG TPA: response regulator transcription factor [Xanthobacteraceae bacterium]|nr:response regulator transcription factor [Xanthobacteraceae bacterium]